MYNQYKTIDVLAKKVGGPYSLSTILVKRARQILTGKTRMFGHGGEDPIQEALDDFVDDSLVISIGEEPAPEEQEGEEEAE